MAGLPTTWGVPALANAVAPVDAPVVERMRAAGAIPIARTNLPDMALRVHTDSSLHGLTRNPWHPGRTAGGSSGGEAVSAGQRHEPDRSRQRHRRLAAKSGERLRHRLDPSIRRPRTRCGLCAGRRPLAGGAADERAGADGPPRGGCAPRPAGSDGRASARPLVDRCPVRGTSVGAANSCGCTARAARRRHRSEGGGCGAACRSGAGRCRLCRGGSLPAALRRRDRLLAPPDHGRFRLGAGVVVPDDGRGRDGLPEQLQ